MEIHLTSNNITKYLNLRVYLSTWTKGIICLFAKLTDGAFGFA